MSYFPVLPAYAGDENKREKQKSENRYNPQVKLLVSVTVVRSCGAGRPLRYSCRVLLAHVLI